MAYFVICASAMKPLQRQRSSGYVREVGRRSGGSRDSGATWLGYNPHFPLCATSLWNSPLHPARRKSSHANEAKPSPEGHKPARHGRCAQPSQFGLGCYLVAPFSVVVDTIPLHTHFKSFINNSLAGTETKQGQLESANMYGCDRERIKVWLSSPQVSEFRDFRRTPAWISLRRGTHVFTPLPPGTRCSTKSHPVESPSSTTVNSFPGNRTTDVLHKMDFSIGGCKGNPQSKMQSNIAVRLGMLPERIPSPTGRPTGRCNHMSFPAHASSHSVNRYGCTSERIHLLDCRVG